MVKVAGVLDRDRRLTHDRCDALQWDLNPVLIEECRDDRSVGGENLRALGQRRGVHGLGETFKVLDDVPCCHAGPTDERQRHESCDESCDDGGSKQGNDADHESAEDWSRASRWVHGHWTSSVRALVPLPHL